jgi:hypothetical protein
MKNKLNLLSILFLLTCSKMSYAQDLVSVVKDPKLNQVDIRFGNQLFTRFLYPSDLEKPVLYPVYTSNQTDVTRGFPLNPKADDPTDHPHHIGIWFNFENVNGLDFWNNSYAIPAPKKNLYGWIKTDQILEVKSGKIGVLAYHANWTNQQNEILLSENTRFEFSAAGSSRIIDRITTLTAQTEVTFTDAKDGMLGMRLAHELQIPTDKDQKFTDDKGNVTLVKGGTDKVANGDYLTSMGKRGDAAWSTRANWCKVFGKMNNDSVTVAIIDHPKNINYPTFWHARGYGLFAANPLGEKIFTNGASAKNLKLTKGQSTTFRYRIVVDNGKNSLTPQQLDELAKRFAKR